MKAMQLIKPFVEYFREVPTDYKGCVELIEQVGRTCYKSEDRMTTDSAERFCKRLIDAKPYPHLAMIEHSNFVIVKEFDDWFGHHSFGFINSICGKYLNYVVKGKYVYIGGNLRAWYERGKSYDWNSAIFTPFMKVYGKLFNVYYRKLESDWCICKHENIPKELRRFVAKFVCDRGVSHEKVRHRPCSFGQESTRYVNYYGKHMMFIEPAGFDNWKWYAKLAFIGACKVSETLYNLLIRFGLKAQQARAVLPNSLKTEIVVTADAEEWAHIHDLRTHSSAHPDMQRVMNMLQWGLIG